MSFDASIDSHCEKRKTNETITSFTGVPFFAYTSNDQGNAHKELH